MGFDAPQRILQNRKCRSGIVDWSRGMTKSRGRPGKREAGGKVVVVVAFVNSARAIVDDQPDLARLACMACMRAEGDCDQLACVQARVACDHRRLHLVA